jgi:hypothetical protein
MNQDRLANISSMHIPGILFVYVGHVTCVDLKLRMVINDWYKRRILYQMLLYFLMEQLRL